MKLNPAIPRIALRYAAGALLTYCIVSAKTARLIQSDPVISSAVATALGVIIGVTTEEAYGLAKKFGWRT